MDFALKLASFVYGFKDPIHKKVNFENMEFDVLFVKGESFLGKWDPIFTKKILLSNELLLVENKDYLEHVFFHELGHKKSKFLGLQILITIIFVAICVISLWQNICCSLISIFSFLLAAFVLRRTELEAELYVINQIGEKRYVKMYKDRVNKNLLKKRPFHETLLMTFCYPSQIDVIEKFNDKVKCKK